MMATPRNRFILVNHADAKPMPHNRVMVAMVHLHKLIRLRPIQLALWSM